MGTMPTDIKQEFIELAAQLVEIIKIRTENVGLNGLWGQLERLGRMATVMGYDRVPVRREMGISFKQQGVWLKGVLSRPFSREREFPLEHWQAEFEFVPPCGENDEPFAHGPWVSWLDALPDPIKIWADDFIVHRKKRTLYPVAVDLLSTVAEVLGEWVAAAKGRQAVSTTSAVLDGPAEPNILWWGGKQHEFQRRPWLVLKALWPDRTLKVDEVIEAAWGHDADPEDTTVRATISRLSRQLSEHALPFSVRTKGGCVLLEPHT